MKIGKDTIATLEYTLRYDGPDGEVIEQYTDDDPTEVLVGRGVLLDILEKNLQDLEPGDGFDFLIDEEQGYGAYDEEKVVQFPEADLMAEVPEKERVELKVGEFIPIMDMEGKHYEALVVDKQGGMVTLDFNEPLAGETLHFRGRVLEVRPASEEEIKMALDE
ncbi:MAG: FKBP-type peptidyl-prolyl cis-trans isomerase [Bacteroidetes bacterium]|uniref:Peptidyl-prolyl cis-trans isomerase n=1 Tax=Candidatus Pullibacteroides excrementavium TaxID=2840905 RepID=A0A9D9DUC3_9BACT|nr:FKBP-type peptidyl-prolyl cis-trans isomerase [Candidatus Pullibacteroides excrementavium]